MKEEIYPHRRTRDDNGDQKFNLSEFVKKLGPGYSDAYQDISEVENYRLGSYFERMSYPQVLQKILRRAIETGLPREHEREFLEQSDIWQHLNEKQKKIILADETKDTENPIHDGLKFLAKNGKFKKSDEGIGKELLSKDFLNYEELKLAQRMLKKYEGVLDPKLYLDILNYKPDKQSQENENGKEEGPTTTEIAEQLIQSGIFRTFRDNESVYYYKEGVYVRNGETKIKEMVHEILEGAESSQFCGEVIGKVQRATYTDRTEFTEHSEHKIVLQNGILNLDTLELQGHTPEWLALTKFPVNFKKDAKCPKILKFISEVARPDDIPLLQEWAGYNLWIFGYPAQKAMLLVGDGGNGKSTLIGIIEYMVGKENRSAVSLHELEENRFARHDLYGKAANLYPDLPDKDLKSTGIFKMLTGGDPIRAEDKNVKAFTYHNVAKLTFSCNAVPRVPEDSVAYFRRWLIVEFPYSFEGSTREDKDLKEKLINDTEEMSGFLNWALEGLQRLRSNGWHFTNGKTVETVREDYIVRSDPYRAFVMHCVQEDPNGQVKKDDLFQAYRDHCEIHKVVSRSRDAFFKNFKDQFRPGTLTDYRPNKEEDPERPRMFKGISLRERSKWCFPDEEERDTQNIQNISTKDPPHNGGLNGLTGLKEVQGVPRVQGVAPHVGYPRNENYSEDDTNGNDKTPPEIQAQESKEDKKTDTPIKNDSPHRPLSPDFQGEPSNSSIQSKKPYKSVGVVLKALEDWGFEVLEYDHVLYEQGKWKAKIKGRFDSHTKEKQEFLDVGFELQFKGSPSADFTWLHFRVEPKKEAIEE